MERRDVPCGSVLDWSGTHTVRMLQIGPEVFEQATLPGLKRLLLKREKKI